MTAKIYQFKKRDGSVPHHRQADSNLVIVAPKTNEEIFCDVRKDVISQWEVVSHDGKQLSELFVNRLPPLIREFLKSRFNEQEHLNFLTNLNALHAIERKLNMRVAVFSPTCTFKNDEGWVAVFHNVHDIHSTPVMESEALARASNILLFLEFSSKLKELGRK